MTPSKSGSRTEERGKGDLQRRPPVPLPAYGRPSSILHPPLTALVAASPESGAYAAGRSRPPCRWGDPFMHAVARRPARIRWPIRFYPPGVRSAPPATAGSRVSAARSAFALRGEPPRLWLSSRGLSRASPPGLAHNALRWRSARCRWPDPWPRRPSRLGWALPPRPEAPPVPQPNGNRTEAVSAAGPYLAGPTPATSFDGQTA